MSNSALPIIVIGAGPIGLAVAAHLVQRGETPVIIEAGPTIGASVLKWAHVRVFSPWEYNVDPVSKALLETHGWVHPPGDQYPTGQELVEQYLSPLAALPEIQPHLRLNTRVTGITRRGHSRTNTIKREQAPFVVRVVSHGVEEDVLAKAVIDASGTYASPNPLGGSGLPALGEHENQNHILYGIPDVLGLHRERYVGRRVLVVGSGHSAFNVILDLLQLADAEPRTAVTWVIRKTNFDSLFGGGEGDQLPERGRLGQRLRAMVDRGALTLITGFKIAKVAATESGLVVSDGDYALSPVDEIVGATGFRPDLELTRELRLALDDVVESPVALAPLIDPNIHSCGTVPPHGVDELAHPEANFYIVGMKSYGRAPTFLLRTGYEQVRSVVLALTGNWEAARQVELVLPETGVCSRDLDSDVASCSPALPALALPTSLTLPVLTGAPKAAACCGG